MILAILVGAAALVAPAVSEGAQAVKSAAVISCSFESGGKTGSIRISRTKDFEVTFAGDVSGSRECRYAIEHFRPQARRPQTTIVVRASRPTCAPEVNVGNVSSVPDTISMEILAPRDHAPQAHFVFGSESEPRPCKISMIKRPDLVHIASRAKLRFGKSSSLNSETLKHLGSEKAK